MSVYADYQFPLHPLSSQQYHSHREAGSRCHIFPYPPLPRDCRWNQGHHRTRHLIVCPVPANTCIGQLGVTFLLCLWTGGSGRMLWWCAKSKVKQTKIKKKPSNISESKPPTPHTHTLSASPIFFFNLKGQEDQTSLQKRYSLGPCDTAA